MSRFNQLKFRYSQDHDYGYMLCPQCGEEIRMSKWDSRIEVNVESRGTVIVPGLYVITREHNNPLCEWGNIIKVDG